jgi:hypothetical protein
VGNVSTTNNCQSHGNELEELEVCFIYTEGEKSVRLSETVRSVPHLLTDLSQSNKWTEISRLVGTGGKA